MLFYNRLTGFMYNNLQSLYKSVRLVNLMATTFCSQGNLRNIMIRQFPSGFYNVVHNVLKMNINTMYECVSVNITKSAELHKYNVRIRLY